MCRIQLPDRLKTLCAEVKQLSGREVIWKEDADVAGLMGSAIDHDGNPTISYQNFSEAGAAEELMHLKYQLKGFAGLKQKKGSVNRRAQQAATMLQNSAHHFLFYPLLEEWGYNPRQAEAHSTRRQAKAIEENFAQTTVTDSFKAFCAMLYVRSLLDAMDEALVGEVSEFLENRVPEALSMGKKVSETIRNELGSSAAGYRATLDKCLKLMKLEGSYETNDPQAT